MTNNKVEEELKNCPFCGGKAEYYEALYCEGILSGVACNDCYAAVSCSGCTAFKSETEKEGLIAQWNTRHAT